MESAFSPRIWSNLNLFLLSVPLISHFLMMILYRIISFVLCDLATTWHTLWIYMASYNQMWFKMFSTSECAWNAMKSNSDHEDTKKTSMCFHGKRFQLLTSMSRVFEDILIARHFSRLLGNSRKQIHIWGQMNSWILSLGLFFLRVWDQSWAPCT